jgi:predicted amidohydrolase YtcJ
VALDLIVTGRTATLAGAAGFGWVEAIGVAGGRVVAIGSRPDIEGLTGGRTRRLELAPDEVALPALTDAHIHLVEAVRAADQVDLSDAGTLIDGLALVAAAHRRLPPDDWLEGTGWDATRWGGWPTASDLDRAAPGRRAYLWSRELHQLWVSPAALALAGIDASTPDPPDGRIRHDAEGRPTGILHEGASKLVTRRAPMLAGEHLEDRIEHYGRDLLGYGIVAVHDLAQLVPDADLSGGIATIGRLADAGRLPVRVHASIRTEALGLAIERGLRSGQQLGESDRARFGWLKVFGDGSLSSRTAFLLEPWLVESDRSPPPGGPRGMPTTEPAELTALARRAADAGIATTIHAIGDATVRAALDALGPVAGRSALSPRVEHLQFVDPADVPRFGRLGVAASIQPIHLRRDAGPARSGLGGRAELIGYGWRRLADSGARLAIGADAPYEDVDPWPGITLAVTRRDPTWPPGETFGPDQALTLENAIRAQTIGGPASVGETDRGRLVAGAWADLMVVPGAAIDAPVEPGGLLATVRPRLVLLEGQVVHEV